MKYVSDTDKMKVALEQAKLAYDKDEIPVGAALFNEKDVVHNKCPSGVSTIIFSSTIRFDVLTKPPKVKPCFVKFHFNPLVDIFCTGKPIGIKPHVGPSKFRSGIISCRPGSNN